MTSRMGMRMLSSREGVCGYNVVQFQSFDGSSHCTVLGQKAAPILFSTNCETPVWSNNGAGKSLKAEPMWTTKIVVADRPWWYQDWSREWQAVLQNPHFTISKLSGDSPRFLTSCCTKSSPGGKKTFQQRRWGTDGSDFMVLDDGVRLLWHRHTNVGVPVRLR